MHVGVVQTRKDLEYGKYHYESILALVRYDDTTKMLEFNKERALSSIELVEEILRDTKEFINSLD